MNRFIFVHIPKCGGTTIRKNLTGIYQDRLCYDKSYKKFSKLGYNKFTVVTDGPILKDLRDNKYDVIVGHFTVHKWMYLRWPFLTMVRDPVERVISQYSAMNLWMPGSKAKKMKRKWGEIKDFALNTRNQLSVMVGKDLDLFSFIGVYEMYERSIGRMEEILQIRFSVTMGTHNKTKRKEKVSKADRAYIESVNREDRELYKEVVRRFISK